jgi:hypothetical protein
MHLRGVAAAGRLMARTGPRPKVAIRQVGAGAVAAPAQQGSRSARFCSRRCFLSVYENHALRAAAVLMWKFLTARRQQRSSRSVAAEAAEQQQSSLRMRVCAYA